MIYIIGLGNPGEKYASTRHNVGRLVLEWIAEREGYGAWGSDKHANARTVRGSVAGNPVEFFEPETYMNKSGDTVKYLKDKHGATPGDVVVVYDDVELPLGELKISVGKGAGGHNGITSIINALGSKDFVRIRVGISPKSFWTGKTKRPTGDRMSKYVLGRFSNGELEKVSEVSERAYGALQLILTDGTTAAMNKYN